MRSSKSVLLMLMTVVVLIAGAAGVIFQWGKKSELEERVAKMEKTATDEKGVQDQLARSQTSLNESRDKLKHLEEGIPELAYLPTFLTELESTGKSHGIQVLGVRPIPPAVQPQKEGGPKPEKKPYVELDIEVKGQGGYAAVMSFLDALQSFPKICAVRSIDLNPRRDNKDPNSSQLDVTVNLRTYLFTTPATGKPASDKIVSQIGTQNSRG